MTCPPCCPTGGESFVEDLRDFLSEAADGSCSRVPTFARCSLVFDRRVDWCGTCQALDLIARLP